MIVYLHKNFILGNTNNSNITDFQYFNDIEFSLFFQILNNLNSGYGLFCGANKKSDNTIREGNSRLAKKYNIFHYHLIKECSKVECHKLNICKSFINIKSEKTASEVLHYMYDKNKNIVVFFGYSRVHDKNRFPSFNSRPLIDRLSYAPMINLNTDELLNYIELSKHINLDLSQKNFNFIQEITKIMNYKIEDLKNGSLELKKILVFYKYLKDFCLTINKNVSDLDSNNIKDLYKSISN